MNPGIHAAISAAQHQRIKEMQEEEERMTRYNPEELDSDWEFKIIRSYSPVFRKPNFLQQVLLEEAQAGWQMLEKLDDTRIRLKRPAAAKRRDSMLPPGIDPYRTQIRGNPAKLLVLLGVTVMLALGVVFFALFAGSREGGFSFGGESFLILGLMVFFLVVGVAVAAVKARG